MATTTSRLGLRKPGTADLVNVATDLNANFDELDLAMGAPGYATSAIPASGAFPGQLILETNNRRLLRWSTNWEVLGIGVVTNTSQIVQPYSGQLVFNSTDNMLYQYRSSAWVAIAALGSAGNGAQRHEARYYQTISQTVGNMADTALYFDAEAYSSNDVTPNGSGTGRTQFTVNRSGVWSISGGLRYPAGTSGERHMFISVNGVGVANRIAGQTASSGLATSQNCSCEFRLNAGDYVIVGCWQSSGAARSLDVGFGQSQHIALTWLRP